MILCNARPSEAMQILLLPPEKFSDATKFLCLQDWKIIWESRLLLQEELKKVLNLF